MHRHLSSLITATALVACAGGQKTAAAPDEVVVDVERMLPQNQSLAASSLEVLLTVRNPNAHKVSVSEIRYTMDTGDVAGALKGEVDGSHDVEANQTIELRFKQDVPFPTEPARFIEILERKSIPIHLTGDLRVDGGARASFDKNSEVATPLLPQFIVYDAQAARYEEEGVDVTLFLRLINDNVFALLVDGVRYDVFVGSSKVHSGQGALGERMLPSSSEEFEVGTILDATKTDKAQLKSMLANRKVDYKVEGEILLKGLTLPFTHSGEIELGSGE